jgi:hypothetical protein
MAHEGMLKAPFFNPAQDKAFAIRAAMRQKIVHSLQSLQLNRASIEADNTYNPAHNVILPK